MPVVPLLQEQLGVHSPLCFTDRFLHPPGLHLHLHGHSHVATIMKIYYQCKAKTTIAWPWPALPSHPIKSMSLINWKHKQSKWEHEFNQTRSTSRVSRVEYNWIQPDNRTHNSINCPAWIPQQTDHMLPDAVTVDPTSSTHCTTMGIQN